MIAGDISPIDVITHLPVFCEDRDVPYIFVPSKEVNPIPSCMVIVTMPLEVFSWRNDFAWGICSLQKMCHRSLEQQQ